jgi:hypothetical protein
VWNDPPAPVEGFSISDEVAPNSGSGGIKRPVRRRK